MPQHEQLYARLRAAILSRHFALGRYNRANHFADDNHLGELSLPYPGGAFGNLDQAPPPLSGGQPRYQSVTDLLERPDLQNERWRVFRHERSNPLMLTGLRLISLAIDHTLGEVRAAGLIQLVLRTTDSLMKFQQPGDPFSGYILRWDPASSDYWAGTIDTKGVETPYINCEFLLNPNPKGSDGRKYLYCTPLDDPRYRSDGLENSNAGLLRRWEPSMDEYVGLIAGFFMVWHVFRNDQTAIGQTVLQEVIRQTRLIATYLRHVGYLLVRPRGGFVGNGHSGINPLLEFAFSRVFVRMLGDAYAVPPDHDFRWAVRLAGLQECFDRHLLPNANALTPPIGPGSLNIAALRGLLGSDPAAALQQFFGAGTWAETASRLSKAVLSENPFTCMDVLHPDAAPAEFLLATVTKCMAAANQRKAFLLFMEKPLRDPGSSSADMPAISTTFKPLLGLTGLDDADPTVSAAYLTWYAENILPVTNQPNEQEVFATEKWHISVFATAVASLLGAPPRPAPQTPVEARLQKELDAMVGDLVSPRAKSDLILHLGDNPGEGHDKNPVGRGAMFGFLAPMSLAWLHKRRQERRDPLPAIALPTPSSMANWEKLTIPGTAIAAIHTDRLPIPLTALQRGGFSSSVSGEIDLFADPPPKPQDETLGREPAVRISEYSRDCTLNLVVPSATGQILQTEQHFTMPQPALGPLNAVERLWKWVLVWSVDITRGENVRVTKRVLPDNSLQIDVALQMPLDVVLQGGGRLPGVRDVTRPPIGHFAATCRATWTPTAELAAN